MENVMEHCLTGRRIAAASVLALTLIAAPVTVNLLAMSAVLHAPPANGGGGGGGGGGAAARARKKPQRGRKGGGPPPRTRNGRCNRGACQGRRAPANPALISVSFPATPPR